MAKGEKNFYANRRRISDLLSSEQPFETAKKMPSPTPTPSPSPSLSQLKMPSPSRSVSLDVCLRLDETIFMCLSIPYFSTILGRLSSSSSKHKHRHHHENLDDETPRRLDRNYDILANRFPVLVPDVKGPFPLPRTTTPLFSSAVVGHTIYILGGDPRDIQGIDDIDHECHNIYPFSQPVLPNPPRPPPPIINQLHNNIDLENNPWPDVKAPETETTTLTETTTWTMPDSPISSKDTVPESPKIMPDSPTSSKDTVPESPKTMPDSPTSSKDTVSAESPPDSLTTVPESPPDSPTSSKDTVSESPKEEEEEEEEEIKGICHKIWTFDLHNPWLGWSAGKSLISPRFYPILVPYQGKLYAFGGNHPSLTFAEVYDPISATWTELPPAPFRRLAAPQMYVVPLNGWNKLWVFGTHRSVDYTYDVLTRKWQKCRGARDIIPLFIDFQKLTSACTSRNHMIVYWMNKSVAVYAYNLSTNQLFEGTLSGVDYEEGLVDTPLALHHLRDDLFCVIGCSYYLDPIRTVLHVSFLQISIKPLPGSSKPSMLSKAPSKIHKTPSNPLTAAVLACFAYPLKGDIDFNHSYLMSKIK